MGMVSIILICLIIFLGGLYTKEVHLKKINKKKMVEQDRMLTDQIIDNLDMKKKLSDLECNYAKQQEMTEEIHKVQEQIRTLKHDMKNHTMVILSYLEEGKTEDAKVYAGEILNKLNKMYTYVNVGNSLLNYVFNNKFSQAKEQGIEIKAEIENLPFEYMDSVDFSALMNNLLDNAICGAQKSRNRELEVQIAVKKGFDVITVKNSIDSSILGSNPELVSTKEEPGHGYGIKQIKNIVEKYDGNIDIYEEKNKFIVSIILG